MDRIPVSEREYGELMSILLVARYILTHHKRYGNDATPLIAIPESCLGSLKLHVDGYDAAKLAKLEDPTHGT